MHHVRRSRFGRGVRAALVLLAVPAFLVACSGPAPEGSPDHAPPVDEAMTIATVDGRSVQLGEFLLFYPENRAKAYAKFHADAGAVADKKFWTTRFADGVPLDFAIEGTMSTLVSLEVEEAAMAEFGIAGNPDYDVFRLALEQENASRADAKKSGRVLYGPVQLDAKTYFISTHARGVTQLQAKLAEGELTVTAAEIAEYRTARVEPVREDSVSDESVTAEIVRDKYSAWLSQRVEQAEVDVDEALPGILMSR